MQVIAAKDIQVPKEDKPRDYITDSQSVEVPDTVYYRRRIADGDLLPAPVKPARKGTE